MPPLFLYFLLTIDGIFLDKPTYIQYDISSDESRAMITAIQIPSDLKMEKRIE